MIHESTICDPGPTPTSSNNQTLQQEGNINTAATTAHRSLSATVNNHCDNSHNYSQQTPFSSSTIISNTNNKYTGACNYHNTRVPTKITKNLTKSENFQSIIFPLMESMDEDIVSNTSINNNTMESYSAHLADNHQCEMTAPLPKSSKSNIHFNDHHEHEGSASGGSDNKHFLFSRRESLDVFAEAAASAERIPVTETKDTTGQVGVGSINDRNSQQNIHNAETKTTIYDAEGRNNNSSNIYISSKQQCNEKNTSNSQTQGCVINQQGSNQGGPIVTPPNSSQVHPLSDMYPSQPLTGAISHNIKSEKEGLINHSSTIKQQPHLSDASSRKTKGKAQPHIYHDYATVPDTMGYVRKKTGGVTQPFPEKLYEMLEKETEESSSFVTWLNHGRAFIVHEPKKFTSLIMPKYFRQTKLTSFQRQLNLYGFRRITQGADAGAYYHELFLRGRPQLCMRMVRQKVKGTGHKQPTDVGSEPNFYAMPQISAIDNSSSSSSCPVPPMGTNPALLPSLPSSSPRPTMTSSSPGMGSIPMSPGVHAAHLLKKMSSGILPSKMMMPPLPLGPPMIPNVNSDKATSSLGSNAYTHNYDNTVKAEQNLSPPCSKGQESKQGYV